MSHLLNTLIISLLVLMIIVIYYGSSPVKYWMICSVLISVLFPTITTFILVLRQSRKERLDDISSSIQVL